MIGEDVPDYLNKCFSKEGMVQDNFDHTDVVWMGNDGNMDPDAVIAEYGWGGHSLLFQLISALIAGYQQKLSAHERDALSYKIHEMIQGTGGRGRPEIDDSALLLEIAYRFHRAHFESGGDNPAILPICEAVVVQYRAELGRAGSDENLPKTLAKKFKKERDVWLSRATMGDDYYAPGRMDAIRKVTEALKLLQEAGIPVDTHQVFPALRPKNVLKRKAK